MPYMVLCEDSASGETLRKQHLREHLDYIEGVIGKICVAGPTIEQGNQHNGSCFVYNTDELVCARKLLENDPYHMYGVYKSCSFLKFVPAAGRWVGGVTWSS